MEALSTHLKLERSHIGLADEVLSMIEFNNVQLAYFILFVSQTTTIGQFALSFNHDIDLAIHQNNVNQLIYLSENNPEEFFVELYDNPELSVSERNSIENIKNLEYHAIYQLIETYNREEYDKILHDRYNNNDSGLEIPDSFLHLCPRPDESEVCETNNGITTCTKNILTYDSCYKEICIQNKKEDFFSPTVTSVVKVPSDKLQIYGKVEKREIICLPYMDFIRSLAISKHNFAKHLIPQLKKQYHKEVAMYSRFLRQRPQDYIFGY